MFGVPLNIYILKAIPSRKLITRLSVMKTALPKKTAQRLKAQFQVIPCCDYASLNFARQPQERIIIILSLHFFAALTNRGINKMYYNGRKAVQMHDQQEQNQTHRLIACRALAAVTNNFWSL